MTALEQVKGVYGSIPSPMSRAETRKALPHLNSVTVNNAIDEGKRRGEIVSVGHDQYTLPDLGTRSEPLTESSARPNGGDQRRGRAPIAELLPSLPTSDMDAALAGRGNGLVPNVLARSDGAFLFYPGRLNVPFGSSESGKGWLLLIASKQELERGRPVICFDFEDSVESLVDRLRKLAVPDDVIRWGFVHINLSEQLTNRQWAELEAFYESWPGTLTVFDAQAELGDLYGKDTEDNPEMTALYRQVLLKVAHLGATVAALDHTPGADLKKLIGAQYKKAGANGTVVRVEVTERFAPGQKGKAKLWVTKDRHGRVRAVSLNPTRAESLFGIFYMESDPSGVITRAEIIPPAGIEGSDGADLAATKGAVTSLISTQPGLSQRAIISQIGGAKTTVTAAIIELIQERVVVTQPGKRKALHHYLAGQASTDR